MERTLIAFNLPNVITITIMAALGYAAFGVFSQLLMRRSGALAGG